jgi:tetratricopeptide (TPR) repeat protein
MRVGKVTPFLLGCSLAFSAIAVRAQGMAEYGAASAASATMTGAAARGQAGMGGAIGGAFGSVVNQLNGASGGGAVAAGKTSRTSAPALNGVTKDGIYDPNLAAKQSVNYSNKLFVMAQQKEKAGSLKEAEGLYRQALGYRENIWGTSDPSVIRIYDILGALSRHRGALAESERCYRVVLMSQIAQYGQGAYEEIAILNKLGQVYNEEKKYGDAAKEYDQIYKLYDRKDGSQDPKTIHAAINLAKTYLEVPETASDAANIMKLYVDALDKGADSNPLLLPVLDTYAVALKKVDKPDLADKVQARADEMRKTIGSANPASDEKSGAATASGADPKAGDKGSTGKAMSKDGAAKDTRDAATKEGAAKDAGAKESDTKNADKSSAAKDGKDSGAKDASAKNSASSL